MKLKIIRTAALLGAVLITGLLAGACGSPKAPTTTTTESVGKQLMDLDQAYKAGTITESQYNDLKKSIIKKND